mmetsp:Transcript_91039/g.266553  ORF Transcript_91039/g.266553 Transcript_91039/m.266553 type:complete len:273 (+) Transcript_91039:838-1656(+)
MGQVKAGLLLQGVREHERKPLCRGSLLQRRRRKALGHGEACRCRFAVIARRGRLARCCRAAEQHAALLAAAQGGEVERGDSLGSAHEVYHVEVPVVNRAPPRDAVRVEHLWMAVVLTARLDEYSALGLWPVDPGLKAQLLVAGASMRPPSRVWPVLVREREVAEEGLAEVRDLYEDKPTIDVANSVASPVLVCHEEIFVLSIELLCQLPQCVSPQLSKHSVCIQHSHMSEVGFRQILGQQRFLLPVCVLTIIIADVLCRVAILVIARLSLPG